MIHPSHPEITGRVRTTSPGRWAGLLDTPGQAKEQIGRHDRETLVERGREQHKVDGVCEIDDVIVSEADPNGSRCSPATTKLRHVSPRRRGCASEVMRGLRIVLYRCAETRYHLSECKTDWIEVRLMTTVRASSKGQIAIPKRVRERLHITAGQELDLTVRNGSIVLTPVPEDPISFLRGAVKGGPSLTEELLQERARGLEHE